MSRYAGQGAERPLSPPDLGDEPYRVRVKGTTDVIYTVTADSQFYALRKVAHMESINVELLEVVGE